MEILNWTLNMSIFTLWMLGILNFHKLFLALFANTVIFLGTIVFFEGLLFKLLADIRPDFRSGLLFPTSKAILSSWPY